VLAGEAGSLVAVRRASLGPREGREVQEGQGVRGQYRQVGEEVQNADTLDQKPLPKAEALVRKANALLKGDPTCVAMLEASAILKEAKSIYDDADEATGPVQDTGYRSGWLKYLAKAGKCRKES
jgi:hypothetical protein